jgi:sugar phosphate isomerase/epimerase
MIELGVFARVFPPGPPGKVAGSISAAGFTATQLNLVAIGRPSLDPTLTAGDAAAISAAFEAEGVRIWAISGTFNAIHPDRITRESGINACSVNIAAAGAMGAEIVTLCTGTRDPDSNWRAHPDNVTPAAWRDLRTTLDALMPVAIDAGVRLGIEPEPGNVIRDTGDAVRLFEQLGADAGNLAVVLDPANLLTVSTLAQQRQIISEAFDLLGDRVAGVHAKDVVASGYAAPGAGGMDYELVMRLHASLPHAVPVIAQDLTADDASRVAAFLAQHAAGVAARTGQLGGACG